VYAYEHFPSVGVTRWSGSSAHSLAWQPRTHAIQYGWTNETFRLKLSADHFDLDKIKTFGIEFSLLFGS